MTGRDAAAVAVKQEHSGDCEQDGHHPERLPGAILELPKLADEELEILVNDKPIGLGRAVKVGENFGIRVCYIGNRQERIAALGSETEAPAETGAADPA